MIVVVDVRLLNCSSHNFDTSAFKLLSDKMYRRFYSDAIITHTMWIGNLCKTIGKSLCLFLRSNYCPMSTSFFSMCCWASLYIHQVSQLEHILWKQRRLRRWYLNLFHSDILLTGKLLKHQIIRLAIKFQTINTPSHFFHINNRNNWRSTTKQPEKYFDSCIHIRLTFWKWMCILINCV